MYSNDKGCRHGKGESVAFQEARRFSGRICEDIGPSRGRLRHNVDEYQRERSRLWRVAQYVIDPAIKTA